MMTMNVPNAPQAQKSLDKTVPTFVAGLMLAGLLGLIVLGIIAGRKHLEF
jgi:hypothetical protein